MDEGWSMPSASARESAIRDINSRLVGTAIAPG